MIERITIGVLGSTLAACGGHTVSTTRGAGGAGRAGGAGGAGGMSGSGGIPITPVCGGQRFLPGKLPVDMLILLDQSASMADSIPGSSLPASWWDVTRQAIVRFTVNPMAVGRAVGIQYFPLGGIAPASCAADYATPDVEVALLPDNGPVIAQSIASHQPTSFKPIAPALEGAIDHMKQRAGANVGRSPVVVLVTDGFPTECDPTDVGGLAEIAQRGFDMGVRTFVVGLNLGTSGVSFQQVSTAGGTGAPILVGPDDANNEGIFNALLNVRSDPPACSYPVPTPPPGTPVDPDGVRVLYRSPGSTDDHLVPRVAGAGSCDGDTRLGWYYDSPTAPTRIELCPAACTATNVDEIWFATGCDGDAGGP